MRPDPSLTEAEWAWCAGLFEGEGCIGFPNVTAVTLSLSMVDRDTVERLDELWPSPNGVHFKQKTSTGKNQWTWQVGERERVHGFLTGIYGWLGDRRRARADLAFERLARNPGRRGTRVRCIRGHVLAGDNLRPNTPTRQCRSCTNERARKYRESNDAS